MTANLIAEALAAGVANTPENGWPEKFYVIFDDGGSLHLYRALDDAAREAKP